MKPPPVWRPPKKFENPALQHFFEAMYYAESQLDDLDYLTQSPRYEKAMAAARRFNDELERAERNGDRR